MNGFTRSGEVRALLSELPAEQLEFLARDWQLWARDEQLPPEPDDPDAPWRVWVILGGRGAIDYEYEQIAYVEYKEWPLLVFLDVDNKKNGVIWTMEALTDKFTRLAAEAYDENGEYYAEDDIF